MNDSTMILSSANWVDEKRKVTVTKKIRTSNSYLHMHDYFEIELLIDGKGVQNLNGQMYELQKGTVYFLSPFDFHRVIPTPQLELINISFDNNIISPQLLTALINCNRNVILDLDQKDMAKIELIANLLIEDQESNDNYSKSNIKNLLETLLIFILRQTKFKHRPELSTDVSPIYLSMRYLFMHFSETPSLEDMARISGYSKQFP